MLPPQKIENSLDYYKKLQLPSLDDFMRWIETDTFKRRRAVRPTKVSFREGLLGCDRSLLLGEKMKDELREIDPRLKAISKSHLGLNGLPLFEYFSIKKSLKVKEYPLPQLMLL